MPKNYFRFKQFAIHQDDVAMKVGTDGVLLGAWANTSNASRILDVGTGTGLVALMLAQRCGAQIDAVEIDEPSARQAKANAVASKWGDRITVYNEPFQSYAKGCTYQYDLIVSNPPYFIKSLKSPEMARTVARHTEELSHVDLLEGISLLLAPTGRFVGIFPYVEGNIFVALAAAQGLFCIKRLNIQGKVNGPDKRLLLEFRRERLPIQEDSIAIRANETEYTPEYIALTKDFYLAF